MSIARVCRAGVWFGFIRSALLVAVVTCNVNLKQTIFQPYPCRPLTTPDDRDHVQCIVVRGDAWPMLLSPCDTTRLYCSWASQRAALAERIW